MTDGPWLAAHPYLEPIARLERAIEEAAATIVLPVTAEPDWAAYLPEFDDGTPLLRSARGPDLSAAGEALEVLVDRLATAALPEGLADDLHALRQALRQDPRRRAEVISWAIDDGTPESAPTSAGLASLLAWSALRRTLAPTIAAFDAWRRDHHWPHGACPTCGAQPSVSQLLDEGGVRHRDLVCSRCATRWRFKRIGCPHCANQDASHLAMIEIEGEEADFRIDYCEECQGYVKTYQGVGDEAVMLADWTTLHLDALAAERGLRRRGAALYEL